MSFVSGFVKSWSHFLNKKKSVELLFTQSGRKDWVSESYKMIDVKVNSFV